MNQSSSDRLLLLSGLLLVFAGAVLAIAASSHGFLGVVLMGIGAVPLCCFLLRKLKRKHPKLSRLLFRILTVFLFVGMLAACVTGGLIAHTAVKDPIPGLEYMVVLGAGVNGTEPSLSLSDRLTAAEAYLKENPQTICVVSGGKGSEEQISEAQCMYNYLTAHGITPQRIWMEDQASDTRENIRFSLALIREKTGKEPAELGILSSEYHLFRAELFARELGITPVGIPAKTSWLSLWLNYYLREIAAVLYYFVLGG